MKQYAKSYELKDKARDCLGGKYGAAILVTFLAWLIPGAVNLLADIMFSPFMPSAARLGSPAAMVSSYLFKFTLSLVLSIVLGLFNVGIALFFLKISCGQAYDVKDLFYGFQNDVKKGLTLSGVIAIVNAVCLAPYQYMLNYYLLTRQEAWLYYAAIAMVIGYCISIPVSLNLALVYYLMLDFPEKSATELLQLSIRLMRGHKRRLFYIQLSFIPLQFLSICSFYVGFLWLTPYIYATEVCFFLDVMNPKTTQSSH